MRKVSFTIIRALVSLSCKLLLKVSSYVQTVMDLLDDGAINDSASVPDWLRKMDEVICRISEVADTIAELGDCVENNNPDLMEKLVYKSDKD